MYIWVVKRLGMLVGVIHRVHGMRFSIEDEYTYSDRTVALRLTCVGDSANGVYPVGELDLVIVYLLPGGFSVHVLQADQLAAPMLLLGQQDTRLLKGLPDGTDPVR